MSLIFWEVPGHVSLRVGDKPRHLTPRCKPPEGVSPRPLPLLSPENPSMPGCHQACRGPNHIAFLLIIPRMCHQRKEKQKEHPCPCSYAVDPQVSLPMSQIPQSSSVFSLSRVWVHTWHILFALPSTSFQAGGMCLECGLGEQCHTPHFRR